MARTLEGLFERELQQERLRQAMSSQRESFLRSRADEAGPVTAEGHVLPVRFMLLNAAPQASADQNSSQACPTITFAQQSQFSVLAQNDAGPVSIPISTQQLATTHSSTQNDQIQPGQQPAQLGYGDHVEVIGDTGFVTLLPIPVNINTSSTLAFANHGDGQAIGEGGVRREDDPLLPGNAVLHFPNNGSTGPAGYMYHYLTASAATNADAPDLSIARPTEASPNMVGTAGATTTSWPHEGEHLLQHREQQQHAPAGRPMSIIENVQDLRALLGSKQLTREDLTAGINSNGPSVDQHHLCQDIIGSYLSRVSTGMTAAATTQTGLESPAAAHPPQAPEAETTLAATADLAAVPNDEEGTHAICVKLLVCQNNIARELPKKSQRPTKKIKKIKFVKKVNSFTKTRINIRLI